MSIDHTPARIWARRMAIESIRHVSGEHNVVIDSLPKTTLRDAADALIESFPEYLDLGQRIADFFTAHGGKPVP